MRTFLHSMSVFASRSLAESIVDSSRDLFSPGRRDYSRHTFPTSSIANANSVSPPLDRVLASQLLSSEDLMPPQLSRHLPALPDIHDGKVDSVPLVSQTTVVQAPGVTPQATIEGIQLTAGILEHLRPRRTVIRRNWQRFLAVHVSPAQALPMAARSHASWHRRARPLLQLACPLPVAPAQSLWGERRRLSVLSLRGFDANRLILRPHALDHPGELLNLGPDESPSGCVVGRACICISEI